MRCTLVLLALASSLLFVNAAEANCGLGNCSWLEQRAGKKSSLFGEAQLLVRHVDFSLGGETGSYLENLVRLQYTGLKDTTLGFTLAPIVLSVGGERHTGMANPILFGERRFGLPGGWSLSAALQAELPFGNDKYGIASPHARLQPSVGASYEGDHVSLQMRSGFAFALDSGHARDESAGSMLYVNPHSDQEALASLALTLPLADRRFLPGLHLDGRYSLNHDMAARASLTAGLVSIYQFSERVSLLAQAELPLGSAQRFRWRVGAGIGIKF